MLRATAIVRKPAVKAERVVDTVVLDHEGRSRRRIALTAQGGLDFLLDLERTTTLADGDALKLEDGRLVRVAAAPQRLLEIRAENPLRLVRAVYHIGNRHTPAEIAAEAIYVEDDAVLAEMVRGLGCTARVVDRPFQPEGGAYDHDCGHDHGHQGHAHADAQAHAHGDHHDHAHSHAHAEAHAHAHHEHDHAHHEHDHAHHEHGHDHKHGR